MKFKFTESQGRKVVKSQRLNLATLSPCDLVTLKKEN